MKSQVAANAVAIASLAREGFRPNGDLIFAATADEEVGAGFGLEWLCRAHPEAVRADFCINEGGGERLELGGAPYYVCTVAEKMSAPFRVRVQGRSGHASMPGIADNALVKAAPLIERLAAYRPSQVVGPEVAAFLAAVGAELDTLPAAAREMIDPLLGPTFSPTIISASQKRNIIPAICDVVVDCRLPPGTTPADVEPAIRAVLGDDASYELEFLEAHGGTRSPHASPLMDAVESFLAETEPEARVVPMVTAGFTDSHWLRDAFGTVAYGFFPNRMPTELTNALIHSADERIAVDELELGLSWLRHAARTLLS
jgi:acetylornithine deacetylase/succinyl-diaminopimelate desuccinylase-like protein